MNALGAGEGKLFLRLRRRFFQRESGAESGRKGVVSHVNSGDPSQMYPRLAIVVRMPQKAGVWSNRIDSSGLPQPAKQEGPALGQPQDCTSASH